MKGKLTKCTDNNIVNHLSYLRRNNYTVSFMSDSPQGTNPGRHVLWELLGHANLANQFRAREKQNLGRGWYQVVQNYRHHFEPDVMHLMLQGLNVNDTTDCIFVNC